MNKRKILLLASALLMVAILGIGGTLAYFTDADKDINVMTVGNIKIRQNETDRDGEAYEDGQALYPAYIPDTLSYDLTDFANPAGGVLGGAWGESVNNEIDKCISVTNYGTLPAYIRTILLMENDVNNEIMGKVHCAWCNYDGQFRKWVTNADGSELMVKIGDTNYSVAICTYETALAAGATSDPSLVQLFLDPSATNEWYDLVGDEFSIIAISQAAQTVGFANAEEALNVAFGEVTAENILKWFSETDIETEGGLNVVH